MLYALLDTTNDEMIFFTGDINIKHSVQILISKIDKASKKLKGKTFNEGYATRNIPIAPGRFVIEYLGEENDKEENIEHVRDMLEEYLMYLTHGDFIF